MAGTATLNIEVRKEVNKRENKKLQKDGYIIGVINQRGMDSIPVAVKRDEFRKALKENGRNAIFKLEDSDKNSYDAMVKTIELSPMLYEYYHIDFQQVSLTEVIKVDVAFRFIGTDSLKPKRLILNRQMDTIVVSGLPQNIPDAIEIDVSETEDGDSIYVKDLTIAEGITIDLDQELMVASITEAKMVEEETEDDGDDGILIGEGEEDSENSEESE